MSIKSIIIINGFILDEKKLAKWAIENDKYASLYDYCPPDWGWHLGPEERVPRPFFNGWYEYFCECFTFDQAKFNKCMPTFTVQGFNTFGLNRIHGVQYIFGIELVRYPVRQVWEKNGGLECKTDNGMYSGSTVACINSTDLCGYCYNHYQNDTQACAKCQGQERLNYEKPKLPKSLEDCISASGIYIVPEQADKY